MRFVSRVLLGCVVFGACGACGGSSSKDGAGTDAEVKKPAKTLTAETPKPASASATGTEAAPLAANFAQEKTKQLVVMAGDKLGTLTDSFERAEILESIKGYGAAAKPIWGAVVASLKDEEAMTRGVALEVLASIDATAARPFLEKGLDDAEAEVREKVAAAWTIAKIKDLAPLLKGVAGESNARVQQALMKTITSQADASHGVAIAKLLGNLDPLAAKVAVKFLVEKKLKDHGATLVDLLNWRDEDLRAEVATALGDLETKTKPALEGLSRALMDDATIVRRAAYTSLKSLSGKSFEFDPEASKEARSSAQAVWKEWITNESK